MNLQDFDALAVKMAGAVGAVVSMRFLQGSIPAKASMAVTGTVISYYVSPYVSHVLGIPEGLSGFLCGVFGMAIVSRVWQGVQDAPINDFWKAVIDRLRGSKGG